MALIEELALIDDLINIVLGYLPELDQYRVRLEFDKKLRSEKPTVKMLNESMIDFYEMFKPNDIKNDKNVFYWCYDNQEQMFVDKTKFTINKKIACLDYPDTFVKHIHIRSKILETLVIDAGRIEKLTVKAPLHTLAVYGFGSYAADRPVLRIPDSVKILLICMNQHCDHRLNRDMVASPGKLNIDEFYIDFRFFESDDHDKEDSDFINYINPKLLWLCNDMHYGPDLLTKIFTDRQSRLRMIIVKLKEWKLRQMLFICHAQHRAGRMTILTGN